MSKKQLNRLAQRINRSGTPISQKIPLKNYRRYAFISTTFKVYYFFTCLLQILVKKKPIFVKKKLKLCRSIQQSF